MESDLHKAVLLFWYFLKNMAFAFTGGMVAMPGIEKDIVERKHWMTKEEYWSFPPIGQSLPGVISIHNSILIGHRTAGWIGSVGAALGVITPALASMLLVSYLFEVLINNPYVFGTIRGIRAISIGLMFSTTVSLIKNCDKSTLTTILIIFALLMRLVLGVSAFVTIILCGLIGIASVYLEKAQ